MATEIRDATHDDLPDVLHLVEQLHAESPRFSRFTFSYEKTAQTLHNLVDNPDGCIFIAVKDGAVVGMLVGLALAHLISEDRLASDLGFYVTPLHRGSTIGARLIKAFETWAEGRNVIETTLEVNTGIEGERTVKLLERRGYKLGGYWLIKRG